MNYVKRGTPRVFVTAGRRAIRTTAESTGHALWSDGTAFWLHPLGRLRAADCVGAGTSAISNIWSTRENITPAENSSLSVAKAVASRQGLGRKQNPPSAGN